MNDVFTMTVLAKLSYCASSWSGFHSAVDRERLEAFTNDDIPTVAEMFENADIALFCRVI